MGKFLVVVGLLVVGAVGWAVFGDKVKSKAGELKSSVQQEMREATSGAAKRLEP